MGGSRQSLVINAPVRAVYNQWMRFEDFARFMEAGESVTQVDATHYHWVVKVAGVTREFDTEITEQIPDKRIAWRSTDGSTGLVTFHRLDEAWTRVMLQMKLGPEWPTGQVGDMSGPVEPEASADVDTFKRFLRACGAETRERRGQVHRSQLATGMNG